MVSAPQRFIDWSQLASALDFEVIATMNSPLLEGSHLHNSSFADLLAPLSPDTCEPVVQQIKLQLQVVNQTLLLLEGQTFDAILQDMLQAFARKVGEILGADRTTVFLADQKRQELWSTVATGSHPHAHYEIRLPWNQGIAGEVAGSCGSVNIPFDFYDDHRSAAAKDIETQTGYRTYTMLALPVLDRQGQLLAVIELLNKLSPQAAELAPLSERIDAQGFTADDEARFAQFSDIFRLILESSQAFYQAARRQKTATVLVKAAQALNHSGLTLESTLERVMQEAQHLLEADRGTIWLVNHDRQDLWTRLPDTQGAIAEVRIPIGEGYAGQVAQTKTTLNIPFDLYERPDSKTAQRIDQASGYRTYSLLCMPVFDTHGDLIAVTQLVNKRHSGAAAKASAPGSDDDIPTCFQTSFSDDDEFFMLAFNIHAGVAIERALLYESLEAKVIARTQQLQLANQQLEQEVEERIKAEQALSKLNRQLTTMARVDPLTQVANRREFDEHIQAEWRRMRRLRAPLSTILCDIDFFKRYNDRYGHPAGDECLRQVAAAMQEQIKRSGDLLARYGGEEFVIVLPNTPLAGAIHVAEEMRQAVLNLAILHEGSDVHRCVTLSLGVATSLPEADSSEEDLIQKTDEALYQAKQQGRNRVVGNQY
ncbi:MAG: diguanylate cyclase [Leptolyngbyaceae cyanobacterium]